MKYKDIKSFGQRCKTHPDHQTGVVTNAMIEQRLVDEIDELRAYIESRQWAGLTDDEIKGILDCGRGGVVNIQKAEQILKEKNS